MITLEQVQGFIDWQQADPDNREVKIEISKGKFRLNPETKKYEIVGYSVMVYDRTINTPQIVHDPSEIDLINERKKWLQRQIDELNKLEAMGVYSNASR